MMLKSNASPSEGDASQRSELGFVVWLFGIRCLVVECCCVNDIFFSSDKFGSKFWSHTGRNQVLYYSFCRINLYPNIVKIWRTLELVAYGSSAVVSLVMVVELEFSLNRHRQLLKPP